MNNQVNLPPPPATPPELAGLHACIIISGSIAAYKACELASRLIKAGAEVQFVATEAALRFVGEASLEGISDRPVYTDLFARRESKTHISLRRWADIFLFYPATANRINEMAAGLAPDLIGATFLANNFEKPFWVAPAMNTNMLAHPATQAGLQQLADWGCRIIEGGSGRLACGDTGAGRLAEPADLCALVTEWWQVSTVQSPPKGRVLITGGAMTEPIDAVRSITNTSSGRTAATIAAAFLQQGWQVDFLHHHSADLSALTKYRERKNSSILNLSPYTGFVDFRAMLDQLLSVQDYAAIVHAAAVSDYHVANSGSTDNKLESADGYQLKLEPNPKLLAGLRAAAKGRPVIVGFKLTVGECEADGARRATKTIAAGQADLVVWNDLQQMEKNMHPFVIFGQGKEQAVALDRGTENGQLANGLVARIAQIVTAQTDRSSV